MSLTLIPSTTIISLGGSIIVPKDVDVAFLKKLKHLFYDFVGSDVASSKSGRKKPVNNSNHSTNHLIIVCGGGFTCRNYQQAAVEVRKAGKMDLTNNDDKDWIGIMATRLNAELLRVILKEEAYEKVLYNPHEKIRTNKKIIIAAGFEPGCSTDFDSVILAEQFGSKIIINASNVDYVYNKDPHKFNDAKRIEHLSWLEYKKLIGGNFTAGMHAPFDPVASKRAASNGMKVAMVGGRDLANLQRVLAGKKFKGTVIG